ncbi:Hint domain-containing protein [Pedobacter mucosus]|uniref:Hint domain-containing protein n=1 Tax=Pedobacter mucosus TaxID=2895286 RepID=UPI001EE43158|nr:Hint domain-containing protein [Pedobacter mucosus]UKT64663.1 Hint domain-containing protein [Pedobacter mucosus]
MKKLIFSLLFSITATLAVAQQKATNPRPITLAEYEKAKTFTIADLDKDSYVKIENSYVLDRYESRKPYFITGDDGLKKRIDLYKLIAKEGMQEIGLMVFYTTETGKLYKALVPDFTAESKVWEKYFQDVDNINKEEKNFILKLSYILSKELAFQQYKVLNAGKNLSEEAGTYGSDICFPGEEIVAMAGGKSKMLKDVVSGDEVMTIDPISKAATIVKVKELTVHEAKNYAITSLVLISAQKSESETGTLVKLSTKIIKATPNHPMNTMSGKVKIGEVNIGDEILCLNEKSGKYEPYLVLKKNEAAGGTQKVFNIVADAGNTFIMNGVMVMQK